MTPAPPTPDLYTGPGFQFHYPAGWDVDEERQGHDVIVTARPQLQSETAFWSLSIMPDRPTTQAALRTVLRALEEEYDNLDAYHVEEQLSGRKALGRDIEFVCLELTNSASVRVFRTRDFTALVLYQATDSEWDDYLPDFRLLTGSLQCGADPLTEADE